MIVKCKKKDECYIYNYYYFFFGNCHLSHKSTSDKFVKIHAGNFTRI